MNVEPEYSAVEDKEILLLNDAGQEVGFNHVGEIAVKSRYLSPGYWGAPALTQKAFRPISNSTDERIYRTRDLGLLLPDGCLLHMGRKNFQVKLRGHRVELAEVEMALLNIDNIKEVAVVLREDHPEEPHLTAYLVPAELPGPSISAVRRALAAQLPDYMVPSVFMFLEALPLTLNGKVDRRALPAPGQDRPMLEGTFAAPRTAVEDALARIWADVLGLTRVGIHDNFFELGGHSLLATQVMSRLQVAFQVELPLRTLFEKPTVAGLVETLAWSQCSQDDDNLVRMLKEVEELSEDEVMKRLQEKIDFSKG